MKEMKNGLAVVLAALMFVTAGIVPATAEDLEMVDRIVATVNDEIITYSMLNEAFTPYEKNLREKGLPLDKELELRYKIRNRLIQQLIDQEITNQAVKKAQISISEEEVSGYIERIKQMSSFTDENLREMLAKEGVSLEQYRKEIRNVLLRNKLIQYEVKSKIVVTQKEIDDYYEKNKDDYKGKTEKEVSEAIADKVYQIQADEKFAKWVADLRDQAQITINE
jgi:peptidyl-prolyl cis-trans isomerase SurA